MYSPGVQQLPTNKMILSDMILPLGRNVAVTARASYVFHCISPRVLHNTKPSHCISSSVDGTPICFEPCVACTEGVSSVIATMWLLEYVSVIGFNGRSLAWRCVKHSVEF